MDSPIASMLVGLCASLGVLGLSQRLSRLPLPTFGLMASGRYSLYLLMFHAPLLSLGSKALQTGLGLDVEPAAWLMVALTVPVCVQIGRSLEAHTWSAMWFVPMRRLQGRPVKPAVSAEGVDAEIGRAHV